MPSGCTPSCRVAVSGREPSRGTGSPSGKAADTCRGYVRSYGTTIGPRGYVSCSRHIAGGRRLVTEDPATGPAGMEPGPGQPSWPTGLETVDDRDGTLDAPGAWSGGDDEVPSTVVLGRKPTTPAPATNSAATDSGAVDQDTVRVSRSGQHPSPDPGPPAAEPAAAQHPATVRAQSGSFGQEPAAPAADAGTHPGDGEHPGYQPTVLGHSSSAEQPAATPQAQQPPSSQPAQPSPAPAQPAPQAPPQAPRPAAQSAPGFPPPSAYDQPAQPAAFAQPQPAIQPQPSAPQPQLGFPAQAGYPQPQASYPQPVAPQPMPQP